MSELGHRQTIKLFAGAVGPVRAASTNGREHDADCFGRNAWQDYCGQRQAKQREQAQTDKVCPDGWRGSDRKGLGESNEHRLPLSISNWERCG
jgi:hypothetical protein